MDKVSLFLLQMPLLPFPHLFLNSNHLLSPQPHPLFDNFSEDLGFANLHGQIKSDFNRNMIFYLRFQ